MNKSQEKILGEIKTEFWRRNSNLTYEETLKLWIEYLEEFFMDHSAKINRI
jgi:hypothetical protein